MLSRYASTMLYFCNNSYYLTEFSGDWAKEAQMSTQQLLPGKKILDTKLGSRAAMHMQPFFELGLDQPAQEHQGDVLLGTIGWTGNFRFTFEVDNVGNLRVIPAINPYASYYELEAGEVFTTPEFIFTLSDEGTGKGSRWIEPEMVNPKSELFEKHPEWAIHYPNREMYYYRNQLVLDLSNPEVQEYVYGIVDRILTENPDVAYFKWDCNSPITNIYSPYLEDRQGRMYIDHVRGVYNVLKKVNENHPDIPMMMCSGGGARCDYEALKYYSEFWCSDNTDPIERLYIQWGFSQFFPAKAMCAHVTSWNRNTTIKFRTDVASMCKLGFDIGLKELSAEELEFCQQAVANWKKFQPAIMDGDQYRLVSPYETDHMAVNYVSKDRKQAILFSYNIHPRFHAKLMPVKLMGLDPDTMYRVEEINLMPGTQSSLRDNGKTFSGDWLMKVGLEVLGFGHEESRVIAITAE